MATLVVKNAQFVNVVTREILPWELACQGRLIVYVGPDASSHIDAQTEVIDAQGQYLVPGLISAHDHNEMTLMSMVPFTQAILPRGTTSVILDPHDTVNVLGVAGLQLEIDEARGLPLHAVFLASPCVPSAPGLENSGAHIKVAELEQMMRLPGVLGVAEFMDYNSVIDPSRDRQAMLAWIREHDLMVDGHCPELRGTSLNQYIAAGPVRTDHESITVDEQLEKLRSGMYVVLRRGSIQEPMRAGDLVDQVKDTSNLLLAVDGCISVEDILVHGHMSWAVRQIIAEGVAPLVAIQMATINVARCYGLDRQVGLLAPGRRANFVLVDDLFSFVVNRVYADGLVISGLESYPGFSFPQEALHSTNLQPISESILRITAPENATHAQIRAIGVANGSLITDELQFKVACVEGSINADTSVDLIKVAVFNRYGKESYSVGMIHGFGLRNGALAGSIGQDSQNIVVVGVNDTDMVKAINRVIQLQGGVVVAAEGVITAEIPLPIAGIMSQMPPEELSARRLAVISHLRTLGSTLTDPIFTLSLAITLVVIPRLKMSDLGLVDVASGQFRSLFV